MKKLGFLFIVLLFSFSEKLFGYQEKPVDFLEKEPPMDGVLYNEFLEIPARNFNIVQSTHSSVNPPDASYRLAYGMSFLYIMIEINSDNIVYRDRAYQNGDGLIVTIAKPKENQEPSDEFYVLGFSPGDGLQNIKEGKFIWYKNVNLSFTALKESKITSTIINGRTYIQTLIYWQDIYPYHPAFDEQIGFNICYVKAAAGDYKTYYYNVFDENIQSEQSFRRYEILKFAIPENITDPQLYCLLSRNTLTHKNNLELMAFCMSKPKCNVDLKITVKGEDFFFYQAFDYLIYNSIGRTKLFFDVPIKNMPPKNFVLNWFSGSYSTGEIKFSILPDIKFDRLSDEIEGYKENVSLGTINTILYYFNSIKARTDTLNIHESSIELQKDIDEMFMLIGSIRKKSDTLLTRSGVFRRAFLSEIDSQLSPYPLRLPHDFTRNEKYPLLVFLHGSGDDDRVAFKMDPVSRGNFIELYPNGRGTSNLYCTPESQIDISEAIKDVIKNYPVDQTKIIISGFSMGGYGAYKTFLDQPLMFKAIAVFSGHPDLASKWLGEGYPNFLDYENLKVFKFKKVFIFHGTEDKNCPYELTVTLAERLKRSRARIQLVTEVTGHSFPTGASMNKFHEWLDKVFIPPTLLEQVEEEEEWKRQEELLNK